MVGGNTIPAAMLLVRRRGQRFATDSACPSATPLYLFMIQFLRRPDMQEDKMSQGDRLMRRPASGLRVVLLNGIS